MGPGERESWDGPRRRRGDGRDARARCHRRARSPLLVAGVVGALALTSCGTGRDGSGEGSAGEGGTRTEVDELVVPDAGPPVLPALDHPLLATMDVDVVRAPEDVDPVEAERWRGHSPGQAVLYGDPTAADPFDEPWALAISHQGSENSEIGSLSGVDHGLSFVDVPVEQRSQETERAGVLSRGVADTAALAAALTVHQSDTEQSTVELDDAMIAAGPERLELLTSARFDVGLLNASWGDPVFAPHVRWSATTEGDGAHVSVTSYAADPGLELLLRATLGGAHLGLQAMPVTWAGDGLASAVRRVGDTTVLVQSESVPLDQLQSFVDSLRPATDDDWTALRSVFGQRTAPAPLPDAIAALSGDLPGGRWHLGLGVSERPAEWGTFVSCTLSVSIEFASGAFGGGGQGGGACPEFGQVSAQLIHGTEQSLVAGFVSAGVERLVVTLDDGTVHEPELVGPDRRLFGVIAPGQRQIVSAEVFDATGTPLADLAAPPTAAATQEQFERLAEFFEQQAAQG